MESQQWLKGFLSKQEGKMNVQDYKTELSAIQQDFLGGGI